MLGEIIKHVTSSSLMLLKYKVSGRSGGGEVRGDVMEDLGRHVKECVIFSFMFVSTTWTLRLQEFFLVSEAKNSIIECRKISDTKAESLMHSFL